MYPFHRDTMHQSAEVESEDEDAVLFDLIHALDRVSSLDLDVHQYSQDTLVDLTVEVFAQVLSSPSS